MFSGNDKPDTHIPYKHIVCGQYVREVYPFSSLAIPLLPRGHPGVTVW